MAATACDGCGLVIEGGSLGCQAILDEILARDFGSALYFAVHRLLIDTYSLQHPGRYCASPKSFAAHVTGLCWLLEHRGNRAIGNERLRLWIESHPQLEIPAFPSFRGRLTIGDVRGAPDAAAHVRAVERWATATWEAYQPLHAMARRWVTAALEAPGRPVKRSARHDRTRSSG